MGHLHKFKSYCHIKQNITIVLLERGRNQIKTKSGQIISFNGFFFLIRLYVEEKFEWSAVTNLRMTC